MRKTLIAVMVMLPFAAQAAGAALPSSPAQMERPQPGSTRAGKTAAPSEALNAASAEDQRVARLKREIQERASHNPVLDKLGPYLGRNY